MLIKQVHIKDTLKMGNIFNTVVVLFIRHCAEYKRLWFWVIKAHIFVINSVNPFKMKVDLLAGQI